jgi:hypothetical protein
VLHAIAARKSLARAKNVGDVNCVTQAIIGCFSLLG